MLESLHLYISVFTTFFRNLPVDCPVMNKNLPAEVL